MLNRTVLITLLTSFALTSHAEAPQGLPAEVIKVTPQIMSEYLDAVGTLNANEAVVLRPEIAGRISATPVIEGGLAQKNDLLIQLDDDIYRAQLKEARARQKLSEIELNRLQKLVAQNATSQTEVDKADANVKIYQAQVDSAVASLEKRYIRAPFTGYAGIRNVSVGEYVNAGTELLVFVDSSKLKLDFSLPESAINSVRLGQKLTATVDVAGVQAQGEVVAISPSLNNKTRSFAVRALVANPDGKLKPGLFAKIKLEIARNDSAIVLPEQALIPQGNRYFVMKVVDGMVAMNPVTLGQRQRGTVQITEGVTADEVVITAGQIKLRPGVPVTPLFPQTAAQ
jgi:membrane fusion protein, multidrug efflux system